MSVSNPISTHSEADSVTTSSRFLTMTPPKTESISRPTSASSHSQPSSTTIPTTTTTATPSLISSSVSASASTQSNSRKRQRPRAPSSTGTVDVTAHPRASVPDQTDSHGDSDEDMPVPEASAQAVAMLLSLTSPTSRTSSQCTAQTVPSLSPSTSASVSIHPFSSSSSIGAVNKSPESKFVSPSVSPRPQGSRPASRASTCASPAESSGQETELDADIHMTEIGAIVPPPPPASIANADSTANNNNNRPESRSSSCSPLDPTDGDPSVTLPWPKRPRSSFIYFSRQLVGERYAHPTAVSVTAAASSVPADPSSEQAESGAATGSPPGPTAATVGVKEGSPRKAQKTEKKGAVSCVAMASSLGQRWRTMSSEERAPYERLALDDRRRYQRELMERYARVLALQKQRQSSPQPLQPSQQQQQMQSMKHRSPKHQPQKVVPKPIKTSRSVAPIHVSSALQSTSSSSSSSVMPALLASSSSPPLQAASSSSTSVGFRPFSASRATNDPKTPRPLLPVSSLPSLPPTPPTPSSRCSTPNTTSNSALGSPSVCSPAACSAGNPCDAVQATAQAANLSLVTPQLLRALEAAAASHQTNSLASFGVTLGGNNGNFVNYMLQSPQGAATTPVTITSLFSGTHSPAAVSSLIGSTLTPAAKPVSASDALLRFSQPSQSPNSAPANALPPHQPLPVSALSVATGALATNNGFAVPSASPTVSIVNTAPNLNLQWNPLASPLASNTLQLLPSPVSTVSIPLQINPIGTNGVTISPSSSLHSLLPLQMSPMFQTVQCLTPTATAQISPFMSFASPHSVVLQLNQSPFNAFVDNSSFISTFSLPLAVNNQPLSTNSAYGSFVPPTGVLSTVSPSQSLAIPLAIKPSSAPAQTASIH